MTDEIRVDIDPRAVDELFRDWHGPVGQAVQQVVDEVVGLARSMAPVSPVGSRYAPPGYLRDFTRESAEHHYDPDTGNVLGLVGAPQYPFNFIASHSGFTANPRSGKHPGRGSRRKATDDYLARAIDAAPRIVIGDGP
jgi:hypothetical protein